MTMILPGVSVRLVLGSSSNLPFSRRAAGNMADTAGLHTVGSKGHIASLGLGCL